jgi:hypothetical protein
VPFLRRPLDQRGRRILIAATAVGVVALAAQGVLYLDGDGDTFGAALSAFGIVMVVLGVVASLGHNPFAAFATGDSSRASSAADLDVWSRTLVLGLPALALQLVGGEILVTIALVTGASDDPSQFGAPPLIGVLFGFGAAAVGVLVAVVVVWPIALLVEYAIRSLTHRSVHPLAAALALLLLTITVMAVLATFGTNAPEVIGTPVGRGLFDIVWLYTHYDGTPAQQVMAWIARTLGAVIVLEVLWIRAIARATGRPRPPRAA